MVLRSLILALVLAAGAAADEITFSYILGGPVSASSSGFAAGPASNILVSDTSTGTSFTLSGIFTASTGAASSFVVTPTFITANFAGAGANTVLINTILGNPLVAGSSNDGASLISNVPDGTGAFLEGFTVSFVDPAVLALFGLGPAFDPLGTVSMTTAHGNFNGFGGFNAVVGGGTVTIQTPNVSVVPEPASLFLLGTAFFVTGYVLRKKGKDYDRVQ